ncbi:MAG: hypothetical protein E6J72_15145 [Deltaproteobacteria bacterium]|nr:MAG: hypothetical protein E6J72_15145 [Deltaproteobacteria bacterium]
MSGYSAPGAAGTRRRSRVGMYGVVALLALMALIVWRSFQVGGVRCEVCIDYGGRSQCRAVDGTSREEAVTAATQNACAFLSSGVTDSMACARTPPTKQECTARE